MSLKRDEYQVGVRLLYNASAPGASYKREHGWTGTITHVSPGGSITINWDDNKGQRTTATGPWWELADRSPTKDEIYAALQLLKRAGDVTFKPKFKDWKKGVDLNANHRAEVSVTSQGLLIKVGCQTFLPEAVEGLAWVVAEARQYQREQCGD